MDLEEGNLPGEEGAHHIHQAQEAHHTQAQEVASVLDDHGAYHLEAASAQDLAYLEVVDLGQEGSLVGGRRSLEEAGLGQVVGMGVALLVLRGVAPVAGNLVEEDGCRLAVVNRLDRRGVVGVAPEEALGWAEGLALAVVAVAGEEGDRYFRLLRGHHGEKLVLEVHSSLRP